MTPLQFRSEKLAVFGVFECELIRQLCHTQEFSWCEHTSIPLYVCGRQEHNKEWWGGFRAGGGWEGLLLDAGFTWEIRHPCGWWCQTEPWTDCNHSCCLALQGQTFPQWCSEIRDKKQLGGIGPDHSAHHTHTTVHRRRKRAAADCAAIQSSAGSDSFAQSVNHRFMLPTVTLKQTLSLCLNSHSGSSPCTSTPKI